MFGYAREISDDINLQRAVAIGHPLHHMLEGTMVQVIHLAQGKQPDGSEGCIVIERCAPGGRTTVARSPDGILVKVPAPFLETEIDAFCRMAEAAE